MVSPPNTRGRHVKGGKSGSSHPSNSLNVVAAAGWSPDAFVTSPRRARVKRRSASVVQNTIGNWSVAEGWLLTARSGELSPRGGGRTSGSIGGILGGKWRVLLGETIAHPGSSRG